MMVNLHGFSFLCNIFMPRLVLHLDQNLGTSSGESCILNHVISGISLTRLKNILL